MFSAFVRAAALAAVVLSAVPARADEIAEYPFSYDWVGGAYADNDTKQFSHCVASADYKSGITLFVSVDADYQWSIGLLATNWKLPVGALNIAYRLDDGRWRKAVADVRDTEFMVISMPPDETVINLFRRGRQMQIKLNGETYYFNLDGTAKLTVELVQCVHSYVDRTGNSETVTAAAPAPQTEHKDAAGSSGTGIVVSAKGYVLTNNHVIKGCSALQVTSSGAAARNATVIRTDEANDLALVQVDGFFPVTDIATFRVGAPLQAGETVAVYGYPFVGMLSQSGNIVAGNITALSGLGDDVRFVQISAPVQPGNSGGPLIDAGGLLVGVVNARMNDVAVLGATGSLPQNVNFAIRGNVAMNFLDAHSIAYKTSPAAADLSLVDIAAEAKRFAVFIQCDG